MMLTKRTFEQDQPRDTRKHTKIDQIKARKKFMACGMTENWFKDKPEYAKVMEEKAAAYKHKNYREAEDRTGSHMQKKPMFSRHFFVQGVRDTY